MPENKDPLSLALANNDEIIDEDDPQTLEADLMKNCPNIDRKIQSV